MIAGILFDKDGTLFDFEASWSGWAADVLAELAGGEAALASDLGARIGFDIEKVRFRPDSVAIAGTLDETARALLPGLPDWELSRLNAYLTVAAAEARMAEAVPLAPYLAGLRASGLRLGVATNDAETPARAHLAAAGVLDAFDYVAGADSGYGAKPDPGMCLGFATTLNLPPERVVMVGDSRHDLHAAAAAGMVGVGVLTGMATAADLEDLAHVVLPDIGHIPGWLDNTQAR
ncbi:HAD family hydrolase [Rhodophyticola porphyridii]|uniref:phosphoglycolate phosphatase n=1 Tax=Rhodophyticola porphyridii TaxID=1852017 RepID=A0A3L9Y2H2_9RHOB|nr:HAD-IA family hydrolase [Rhodophyticola porphyridii]RMA43044.1 HAD family hydrolase [Rhodophyticola porphyridii]